jgi:inner membrane protein
MANGKAHRIGAALAVGTATAIHESTQNKTTAQPLINAGLGYCFGTIPDILEPANNPNHRKFCHSLTCAGLLSYGFYKAYKWQPDNESDQLLRKGLLVAIGAYGMHLLMDASTPKGLPII